MELPNRKSIRLQGFDYSSEGAYFITICTKDREYLFGDVVNRKMILNEMGRVVNQIIQETPKIRKNVQIDIYQIMPNHVHIIIMITNRLVPNRRGELNSPPNRALGSIIRGLKSVTTKQIRIITNNPEFRVWQRNYFEHIIRNDKDYEMISQYIINNPVMWPASPDGGQGGERDRNNPENLYV